MSLTQTTGSSELPRVDLAVAVAAVALILLIVWRTAWPERIARMRANGGYVLIDNHSRHGFVVKSYDLNGDPCGEVRIAAGNRERAAACGPRSRLRIRGRDTDLTFMAAQSEAFDVVWTGQWSARPHAPY